MSAPRLRDNAGHNESSLIYSPLFVASTWKSADIDNAQEDTDSSSTEDEEELDDDYDERFQAISPNRPKTPLFSNKPGLTSTDNRAFISRNAKKQISLQAAMGSLSQCCLPDSMFEV